MITNHSENPSSKFLQTIKAKEGVQKKEHFYTVSSKVNWYNYYEKEYESAFKTLKKTQLPYDPAAPLSRVSGRDADFEKTQARKYAPQHLLQQRRCGSNECSWTDKQIRKWNMFTMQPNLA